jgi:hypothetical protein
MPMCCALVRGGRSICDDAPPPPAPVVAAKPSSPPHVIETVVSKTGGTGQELSVDDYLVRGVTMFDAQTRLPLIGKWNDLCF